MKAQKGVEIYLTNNADILAWLAAGEGVSFRRKKISKAQVVILTIKKGEADFLQEGCVGIRLPRRKGLRIAFLGCRDNPRQHPVLKIVRLEDGLSMPNHYLCSKCFTNTGRTVKRQASQKIHGRIDVTFDCSVCGHQWEVLA